MSKIDNPSDIRKTLLRNGYVPLPNRDKRCFYIGWPNVAPTEDMIALKWARMHKDKATGVRIDWPLGFVDNDISDMAVHDDVVNRWISFLPDVFDGDVLLARGTTASVKTAYFVRMAEKFGRLATHVYRDARGEEHFVEIYGGGSARQAGAYGAHSVDKGTEYVWPFESLLEVPLEALPQLTQQQCVVLLSLATEAMVAAGWTKVEMSQPDDGGETRYDITGEMTFESRDSVYSLDELKAALTQYPEGLRLTGGWHDPASRNVDNPRCIARLDKRGELLITDFGEDGLKHREASKAQPIDEAVEAAFAALGGLGGGDKPPEPPKPKASAAEMAARLLLQYAYLPTSKTPVIPIFSPDHPMPQGNFVTDMLKHSETRQGKLGGEQIVNPAKLWLADPKRITIKGVQMRADQSRPFFEEDGDLWLNSYRPPVHAREGGNSDMLWELISQIAPYEEERKWLVQNLSFKFRHPEIPGPGVIMLAQDEFGTGRGTFMKLLEKLFGDRYVTQLPAHLFTGSSYQSQYTEWLADSLIVCVEEMIELKGGSKWSAKHDVYERLKELIEPRMKRRKIVRKGMKSTEEFVSCSIFAFLNNLDDVPIHERDRRCFAMRNGGQRDAAFWTVVNASLDNPADVAAFARDLLKVDLAGYSPYDPPPVTEVKEAMAEAAKPDLLIGLDAVIAQIEGKAALFSMLHIINGLQRVRNTDGLHYPDQWESWVGKIVGNRYFRVGIRNGRNWKPHFDGKRWATYAWTRAAAAKWKDADAAFIEKELRKTGPLKSSWSGSNPFGTPDGQDEGDDSGGED